MEKDQTATYTFTRNQFVGLLLGAVVSAFVAGAFGAIRTLNNDHFTIVTLYGRVVAIEENFVPRSEVVIQLESLNKRLDRIENKLDNI